MKGIITWGIFASWFLTELCLCMTFSNVTMSYIKLETGLVVPFQWFNQNISGPFPGNNWVHNLNWKIMLHKKHWLPLCWKVANKSSKWLGIFTGCLTRAAWHWVAVPPPSQIRKVFLFRTFLPLNFSAIIVFCHCQTLHFFVAFYLIGRPGPPGIPGPPGKNGFPVSLIVLKGKKNLT